MDFALDPDQQAVVDAVASILADHAGSARARELGSSGHDDRLLQTLATGGFLDLWAEPGIGPLVAAIVTEEASRANARANIAIRTLVLPSVLSDREIQRVAITHRDNTGPVRFGQHADVLIVVDGDRASIADITSATAIATPFGYPYAVVTTGEARTLDGDAGSNATRWWRVALAAEISGALQGAVAHTTHHLSQRIQFGKPLGSLQALQHRLAEAHVWAQGAKWLARAAAWHGAPEDRAATAATYAAQAAQVIGADMHQLSGAIGFTTEFDLHLWTTRLHALRVELGGARSHAHATTQACWG